MQANFGKKLNVKKFIVILMDMNPEAREIYPELKKIENDIQALKILVAKCRKMPRQTAKLEGLLKQEINEAEIEEAKKSIFKFRV